jgi:hypothetical protein
MWKALSSIFSMGGRRGREAVVNSHAFNLATPLNYSLRTTNSLAIVNRVQKGSMGWAFYSRNFCLYENPPLTFQENKNILKSEDLDTNNTPSRIFCSLCNLQEIECCSSWDGEITKDLSMEYSNSYVRMMVFGNVGDGCLSLSLSLSLSF